MSRNPKRVWPKRSNRRGLPNPSAAAPVAVGVADARIISPRVTVFEPARAAYSHSVRGSLPSGEGRRAFHEFGTSGFGCGLLLLHSEHRQGIREPLAHRFSRCSRRSIQVWAPSQSMLERTQKSAVSTFAVRPRPSAVREGPSVLSMIVNIPLTFQ